MSFSYATVAEVPMVSRMDYKTIERVPIVSTGTYALSNGETSFTTDDLAAAVLASNDPTVPAPRIKIGHTDKRFESDPSLDGEPAMGTVQNMALSEDGQTIVADLVDVPAWLADSMQSAFPNRSIEGGFGFDASSGHTYGFAISKLALLGETWPGIGSLDDLRDVLSKNGPIEAVDTVEASSERFVRASVGDRTAEERRKLASEGKAMSDGSFPIDSKTEVESAIRLARTDAQRAHVKARAKALGCSDLIPDSWQGTKASISVGSIPRVFAADLRAGRVPPFEELDQSKWWPRSVEAEGDKLSITVDTEAGKIVKLPITVSDKTLTYGDPVTASVESSVMLSPNLKGPVVLASWPNMALGPSTEAKTMQIKAELDQAKVAKRLGLPEDADEAAIEEALVAEPPAEPVAASAKLPDGVVAIDSEVLASLQAGAASGAEAKATLDDRERDEAITSAIDGGRIVAASRESWEQRWATNRDEARKLLCASVEEGGLAAHIPVEMREAGRSGDGEADPAADVAVEAAFDARFFPELVQTDGKAA